MVHFPRFNQRRTTRPDVRHRRRDGRRDLHHVPGEVGAVRIPASVPISRWPYVS